MNITDNVYGASGKVYIQFSGTIEELANLISDKLCIPKLRLENREDEPYDIVGYSETMGFEITLQATSKVNIPSDYNFMIEAITQDCFRELFNDCMHDISHWLARYLTLLCECNVLAINSGGMSGQIFCYDKVNKKRFSETVNLTV